MLKVHPLTCAGPCSRTANPEVHAATDHSSYPDILCPTLLAYEKRPHPSLQLNNAVFLFNRRDN